VGLKKTSSDQDHEIVRSLVNIAAGLKRAVQTHVLEAMDLEERLAMVERMLKECMSSDSMDDEKNVAIVLQSRENDHKLKYEHLRLSEARSFISGPLELCIKYKLYGMIGTAQVRIRLETKASHVLIRCTGMFWCTRCRPTWTTCSQAFCDGARFARSMGGKTCSRCDRTASICAHVLRRCSF